MSLQCRLRYPDRASNRVLTFRIIAALFLFGFLVTGCASIDSGIDVDHNSDGTRVFYDTPRMWTDWTSSVDREVVRERLFVTNSAQNDSLRGRPNGGGSWEDYWRGRIAGVRSTADGRRQENPERYVGYIYQERRKAGLPELPN